MSAARPGCCRSTSNSPPLLRLFLLLTCLSAVLCNSPDPNLNSPSSSSPVTPSSSSTGTSRTTSSFSTASTAPPTSSTQKRITSSGVPSSASSSISSGSTSGSSSFSATSTTASLTQTSSTSSQSVGVSGPTSPIPVSIEPRVKSTPNLNSGNGGSTQTTRRVSLGSSTPLHGGSSSSRLPSSTPSSATGTGTTSAKENRGDTPAQPKIRPQIKLTTNYSSAIEVSQRALIILIVSPGNVYNACLAVSSADSDRDPMPPSSPTLALTTQKMNTTETEETELG
ncbi:hypothetical protein QAD02_000203 [Eretmocerus hayati]|uniref:Uncharacterized protein n=1 Tax=Eretmocerus hayati TaxID=131215 RepID=A0ACC2NF23_9HYME|nr:hypothetical protein QAD02_000203 [Eretmocerus hayati]